MIVGDFNTPLSMICHPESMPQKNKNKKETMRETKELTDIKCT
jgi:hypothetical protein